MLGIREDERETQRELGLERADTLSQTTLDVAQAGANTVLSLCRGLRTA